MTKAKTTRAEARRTQAKPSRIRGMNRPVDVEIHIDRDLKRRWDEAIARVTSAKREGAGAFDELWETIGQIVDHTPPLYLAGGFASAKQFYKEHVGESERTAKRLIRVAKYASPAEEARYGISKLDAALGYIEAAAGGEAKGRIPIDFAKLRIQAKRNGTAVRLPLQDASVEEVRAATRSLRGPDKSSKRSNESPAVAVLRGALREVGADGVKVQIVRGVVSLSAIPLASLAKTLRALASAKLPAEAAPAPQAGSRKGSAGRRAQGG